MLIGALKWAVTFTTESRVPGGVNTSTTSNIEGGA